MTDVMAMAAWPTNAHLIADVAALGLLKPQWHVLDATHGLGGFWTVWKPEHLVGWDINPAKSLDGSSTDFRDLPAADRSFDAVVFDPDYKLTGTPWDRGGMDERYGTDRPKSWRARMKDICDGAGECARVADRMLLVKCQDQVVSSKIRWQTKAVADVVEPLGFGLRARFDYLSSRDQPSGRRQVNPRSCSSQLLVFQRGWDWWR